MILEYRRICFRCGKEGHLMDKCPQRPTAAVNERSMIGGPALDKGTMARQQGTSSIREWTPIWTRDDLGGKWKLGATGEDE
ncbi:unnamed protein product [Gordionus sp. m RMFG-2023]